MWRIKHMNIILGLILIAVVLILVCTLLLKIVIAMRKDNRILKNRLEKRNENIRCLLEHSRSLGEIQKDSSELIRRIRNAQNDDDDIDSIICDVIKHNNNRVQESKS